MAVSRTSIKWLLLLLVGALLFAGVHAVGAQENDPEDVAGMLSIAATTFEMGEAADVMLAECNVFRSGCEASWFGASQPVHTVELDAFSIDETEVTNEAFLAFINELGAVEDACDDFLCLTLEDSAIAEEADGTFSVDEELLDHPVVGVTWYGANAFCEWRGARLPTEAEWELAAGWDFDEESKRFYPWGDEFDGEIVNFCDVNCAEQQANSEFDDGYATTAPIGSYEDGRSAAGLYDVAGNVWEWVNDWYDPGYYAESPVSNPQGPDSGDNKVVRGGSWFDTGNFMSTAIRFPAPPSESGDSIGFRCASDNVDETDMIGETPASETPQTPLPTTTATREATATPTVQPTATATSEPTDVPTTAPTATPTEEPTATPTRRPTLTPQPTATATEEPEATATEEPEATATVEPAETPGEGVEETESSAASTSLPPYFYCSLYPGEDLGDRYVVGACDNLTLIARKLGVPYAALLAANPQIRNPNVIWLGDVLNVPGESESVPRETPPPAATMPQPATPPVPSPEPAIASPTPIPATPSGSTLR